MRRWTRLQVGVVCALVLVFCVQAQAQVVQGKPIPSAQTNGRVDVIAVSGTTAYIGGTFTSVRPAGDPAGTGEQPRNHAAAIDLTTGTLLPWNPAPATSTGRGSVVSIAVDPTTGNVYLGGSFSRVGAGTPISRKDIAEVNGATGAAVGGFKVRNLNAEVQALYFDSSAGDLYVGGRFTTPRPYVARVNSATGALDSTWAPVADAPVEAITKTMDGSNEIVLGGAFRTLDGVGHVAIGAVDSTSGATALPWAWQGPSAGTGTKYQFDVVGLTADPSGVYAAGTGNGGTAVKLGPGGNELFEVAVDGNTVGVAVMGGELYVAGHFNYYCGNQLGYNSCGGYAGAVVRHHLLAVDATSGLLQSWHPSANSKLGVFALAGGPGYLTTGGDFTKLGGLSQQGFGEFPQ